MIELNRNIQLMLEVWKISQDDLGKRLGLGRGIMNNIIKEKTRLTVEQLMTLEELTGFSARELLFKKLNRLDISERPLSKEEGLSRLIGSNVNIQLGDSNGDVVQHIGQDERVLFQQTIAAQGKTIALLEKRVIELEVRLDENKKN